MKINLKAFTLVELLIVITIIGVISGLVTVYFNTARMAARDARRLADVKQVQLALKMYYSDLGYYPTVITIGQSIANGGTNYLLRVPSNPEPRDDNGCLDQDYTYYRLDNGERYSLGFCLGDKTDDLDAGIHVATANGILNCPTGYVAVPGSSVFQTNDFCVMQYEAKCALTSDLSSGLADGYETVNNTYDNSTYPCTSANSKQVVSITSGYPIANINRATAETYCQSIGGHLITNPEWMSIVRNAELVANATEDYSNWDGNTIGSGSMPMGIINQNLSAEATNEFFGECPCTVADRRTLVLTSGQKIWDIAGSVSEWLNTTCQEGTASGEYYYSGSYVEWSLDSPSGVLSYERGVAGPSSATYNHSSNGIGQYEGCASDGYYFIRGGNANESESNIAGVYNLYSDVGTSSVGMLGFRCVK
ncbi:MAG: type II secretion system protein [Candidatus Nanoarchaeia archaeon]|jgi:general secretion pathway protein G